jgi:CHASE3 domain sensor protein
MNRDLSRFSGLIYSATICIMLLSGFVLYRNVRARTAALERVSHTQDVMLQLEEVESLVKDAETGQRGYLLTGDQEYLNPYTRAQSRIEPALSRLASLTSDNPRQQARITELRGVIDAKLTELEQTLSLYDEGKHTEALQIVHSNLGREVMNQARGQLYEMRQEESQQLQLRQKAWSRATRNLVLAIALSTGANFFLLLSSSA